MKLEIEMIPSSTWYKNLRNMVTPETWRKIRFKTLKQAKYRCETCNTQEPLECHEVWKYNYKEGTQKLIRFKALCQKCHRNIHYGLTKQFAKEGKLKLEEYHKHFCNVNKCSQEEMNKHIKQAFIQWEGNSTIQWVLDLGEYEKYLGK